MQGGGGALCFVTARSAKLLEMITAVYPGTFDPLTRGHEDLVRRAAGIFETLIVGVAIAAAKGLFLRWMNAWPSRAKRSGTIRMSELKVLPDCSGILCAVIGRAWWCAGCAPSRILSMSFRWRG